MTTSISDNSPVPLKNIPQGAGSRLDSDTIDGLQTSTAIRPSPNTIVPVDNDGQYPISTLYKAMLFSFLMGQ